MKVLRVLLLAMGVLLAAAPAMAFVVQTINVDGVNDFDPQNLLDDDRNDTQTFCTPSALPLDLGRVYVTNDANFLYLGIEFSQTCFCQMNLGFSIDVGGTAAGGTTDPFGRSIGWANLANKPDWVVYDVTPVSCDMFNYEILYKDSSGTWLNKSTLINPAWGSGANGLGIVDSLNFKELKLPLSVLGASTGTPLRLEFWVTQEGPTKGPLDALASDNVQMSRVGQTTFDTTAVVQMTSQFLYTVLSAVDNTPPTVSNAQATAFPLLANRQFNLNTNRVDVTFSEPVELTTAQTPGNYAFTGPSPRTVISAVRDPVATNIVRLTLNSAINANAGEYRITVSNVRDAASNVIVANGTTNVGAFYIQNVVFNGDFRVGLCGGNFAPSDTFAVEGSLTPLTFALCDNALMTDTNLDSIYTVTVPFVLPKNLGTGLAQSSLDWKFSHRCSEFEPISGNRTYLLDAANGASVPLNVAWNNDDPANFTNRQVRVVFQVDATRRNPTGGDVITLLGSSSPLSFTQPGLAMLDNGVAPDLVAGDKIYTTQVTFPACAPRSLRWKVDFNGAIECATQGDRTFTLNDAVYSVANPLVLPARGIDRCEVTDKPLTVVFKVRMDPFNPPPSPSDTVAVMGNGLPLNFDYPLAAVRLFDNGVAPDDIAGDAVYSRSITFPDSTNSRLEFKYWENGSFECTGAGNRVMLLDDVANSSAVPIVRLVNVWDYCSDPSGVPSILPPADATAAFARLLPVMPNPVTGRARFAFDLRRSGRVTLSLYDVSGRRIARLFEGELGAGSHSLPWDGSDLRGARLQSGVYVYELAMGREHVTRRLIVTQ